jgi:GNAT superfamily N-acetyltransferase
MQEEDLHESDRIMRLAFGTFLGLPDPMTFMGDADFVTTRFRCDPSAALVACDGNRIVGSNFSLNWGSVGIFGPLTVHPDYWDKGVARALLKETMKIFERWATRHMGLFTFSNSSKHVHLYEKFGFWSRYLTAVMSKQIGTERAGPSKNVSVSRYSELPSNEKESMLERCRGLTDSIYPGLDLRNEIISVDKQRLGDTILLLDRDDRTLLGTAICHIGPGTEAGSGNCYVKFGAVKPASNSAQLFDDLLNACEGYGIAQNLNRLTGGANMGRHNAYRRMIERGFRTDLLGVAMHRPNEPGYHLPDVYVIDDWR